MTAREFRPDEATYAVDVRTLVGSERVERRSISRDDRADVVAGHVEHGMVSANPGAPEARQELRPLDRSGMQQPISTGGVRRDWERVSGGIGELDIRVLLHAEIATRRRNPIECRGEHAMLDGHAFRAAIQEHVEAAAIPRSHELCDLLGGELDGSDDAPRAESKELGRAVGDLRTD